MLSVPQAAALLVNRATRRKGVSRARVLQMIASGLLRARKDRHGCYDIDEAEVKRVNSLKRKNGRPRG